MSQLRRRSGRVISTRPPGYVLELDPERVDLHRFARLADESREALRETPRTPRRASRGARALAQIRALDFPYEPFAQTEIARLEELRHVSLEERSRPISSLAPRRARRRARGARDAQPHRERPRAQLMLALYRAGRQADALAAYRAARETLVEELGTTPGLSSRSWRRRFSARTSRSLPEAVAYVKRMQFRRLVTILFVDVVESMALAEALDPEALGRLLQRYFETASRALTRHGGTVEKFAGDAVMAAFGVPVSHEDDALRAARAALDIQAGVAALSEQLDREHGIALEVPVWGIAAGEVVTTPTEARQRFVAGDAVGVAARLEQAAGAGEIVVGEVVARLIDHAARLEPLGELEIREQTQTPDDVPARRDHARRACVRAPTRRAARRAEARAGRAPQIAQARRRGRFVCSRCSSCIGPPGVGKSRLAAELAGAGQRE